MAKQITVGDIMTTPVHVLWEEDNLQKIRRHMQQFNLRHLPVVDNRKLVGLISHRDILRLTVGALEKSAVAESMEKHIEQTFVSSVMTRDVTTVSKSTPIDEAARLMLKGRFGCLPVVDDSGILEGIVTEHDFLKAYIEGQD